MSEILESDFDEMLADTERLAADREAKNLTDYRCVVAGRVRIKPEKLLALLSAIGLTPIDFRADAAAWAEHQKRAKEIPPAGTSEAAQSQLAAAIAAHGAAEKTWFAEDRRLQQEIRDANLNRNRIATAERSARERIAEIIQANPRIFSPAPAAEEPEPSPTNSIPADVRAEIGG